MTQILNQIVDQIRQCMISLAKMIFMAIFLVFVIASWIFAAALVFGAVALMVYTAIALIMIVGGIPI